MSKKVSFDKLGQQGFTLIELVIVIVTLGIIAVVAIPRFTDISSSAKKTATKDEMLILKRAIIGNPQATAGGSYIDVGFEGDCGFVPSQLSDLVIMPGSLSVYDPISRLGWNGPYVDSSNGEYLKDAWGNAYNYYPALRRIVSYHSGDSIVVTF